MFSTLISATLINLLMMPNMYHESEPAYSKNRIDNYDVITISQSGSLFYSVTNQIIESSKNLNTNLTFIGRANIGLDSVLSESGELKLSSRENYLYSVSVKTIESSVVEYFYDEKVAEVIENNQIVISSLTAERYGLSLNDKINFVGINLEPTEISVGMILKDSELGWFEGVVNKELGYKLGIFRNIQAII